ncbi:hypothetical protein NM208_g1766 [Fusarium decemcellulare]|uniref:Uncharacterized protein n=1 Tax=Fusarium decemcellulare TaxID=57161 RepID=A0ACC1SV99_9HYPO|nr:hypothetical protein NM208_g1766 [Fusarium decemcellulare]
MSSCFCCDAIRPYRPQWLDHEAKFTGFVAWAKQHPSEPGNTHELDSTELSDVQPPFAVQLVRQVNYGPLESKRYFVPLKGETNAFKEVSEGDLIRANFQKLNSAPNALVADIHILALENIAREESKAIFTGRYVATDGPNSSMTFTKEKGYPGLGINEFIINGSDILAAAELLLGFPNPVIRFYATDLKGEQEDGSFEWSFRFDLEGESPSKG